MWNNKSAKKGADAPIETLIGKNTHIVGDVTFAGGLHLEGSIKGNLHSKDGSGGMLVIGEGARVEGEVRASNMIVNGTVDGDLFASERLELASHACIKGNVHYGLIEMAIGAEINGNLIHMRGDILQLEHRGGHS